MDAGAVERAAATLVAARRTGRKIAGLAQGERPADLDDAYAIQARVLALLNEPVSGWFLACTGAAMQKAHGLPGPYFGRMLASAVHSSPAALRMAGAPGWSLEIEIVFRLGRDLPARARVYSLGEVADAVAAMYPGLELVEGRFHDMLAVDGPTLVADNGTDGLLVLGPAVADWRALDRPRLETRLMKNGAVAVEGSGAAVMGDPLAALHWLANEAAARGMGLGAGETVNTGNCLARYCFGAPGDEIVADCGPLGTAAARLLP